MKKNLTFMIVALTVILSAACSNSMPTNENSVPDSRSVTETYDTGTVSSNYEADDNSTILGTDVNFEHSDDENLLFVPEYPSEEEMIDYIIADKDDQADELFENDKSRIICYNLDNVPEGYELSSVRENGNFLTYDYKSKSGSKVTFVWGFGTEGDEYLKNAVEMFELEPLDGYEGYYYSKAVDDSGTEIYQIYWSEDGYCFQVNIPVAILLGESDNISYDFSITKKNYDIEE